MAAIPKSFEDNLKKLSGVVVRQHDSPSVFPCQLLIQRRHQLQRAKISLLKKLFNIQKLSIQILDTIFKC